MEREMNEIEESQRHFSGLISERPHGREGQVNVGITAKLHKEMKALIQTENAERKIVDDGKGDLSQKLVHSCFGIF